MMKAPRFITPQKVSEPPQTDNPDDMRPEVREKLERNKKVRQVRARVELAFGILEKKFKILSKKFADGPAQLDHLVTFAAGVLNTLHDN